jgi:hypothetical protein
MQTALDVAEIVESSPAIDILVLRRCLSHLLNHGQQIQRQLMTTFLELLATAKLPLWLQAQSL